jgi:plastocyanin
MRKWFMRFPFGLTVLAFLPGSAPVARADTIVVSVESNHFSPTEVFIATGDTIRWEWNSGFHTTTSFDGFWDSDFLGPGSVFEQTFTSAGDFSYYCTLHLDCCNMAGIIHVMDPVILVGSLSPTDIDPQASGDATFEMVPYRTTFSVAVQGVSSTNALDVFVNGNFVNTIALDAEGNGNLNLNTDNGDMVPVLMDGDEVEIFDAADNVTLILIGNVHSMTNELCFSFSLSFSPFWKPRLREYTNGKTAVSATLLADFGSAPSGSFRG